MISARERGRHGGAPLRDRLRLLLDLRREHLRRRSSGKRTRPGEHLVGDAAERVEVGAMIDVRVRARLFRRHVRRRAECDAQRRQRTVRRPSWPATSSAFATPKSVTTATPPGEMMLSGLMSRCTMPSPCAYASADGDVAQDVQRVADRQLAALREPSRSDSPFTNGIV